MREDWTAALIAAGLRPDSPTVWLVDGLFYYLGRNAGDSVLKRLSAVSAPVRRWRLTFRTNGSGRAGQTGAGALAG